MLPPLPVSVPEVELEDDSWLRFFVGFEQVAVPDELYLRELQDIDPFNVQDILRFTRTWGRLGAPDSTELGDEVWRWREFDPVWAIVGQRLGEVPDAGGKHSIHWNDRPWAHANEFTAHAIRLRNATQIWLRYQETDGALDDLEWLPWEGTSIGGRPAPTTPGDALNYLAVAINGGMRAFRPHLRIEGVDNQLGRTRTATLYEAMAAQLMNHVSSGARYRRCANEKCGRLFVHKRSGDQRKYDIKRSEGIKFCSTSCSSAQTQRQYRRRQQQRKADQ